MLQLRKHFAGAASHRPNPCFVALSAFLLLAIGLFTAGCGKFFPPISGGGGGSSGGGGGTGTGNFVYVENSNTSLNSVSGFSIGSNNLNALANSPYQVAITPVAMAINPAGTLVWVAGIDGSIYVYVIQSDGSLALGNSGNAVAQPLASSIAVDPSGNYLLALSGGLGSAPQVTVYQINSRTGQFTTVGNPLPLDNGTAAQIVFTPDGTRVFAALGTGGVDSLTFSNGTLGKLSVLLSPLGNGYADQGLAVDPASKYLFVVETGLNGVRAMTINSNGSLTPNGSPYPTGLGAKSALVTADGAYVYVANSAASTISGFSLAGDGTLTALSGSPFATGSGPAALAEDTSGTYILAACTGGNPDLQVYTFGGGTLTSVAQVNTASQSPAGASALVVAK